jgi:hypothetical protein
VREPLREHRQVRAEVREGAAGERLAREAQRVVARVDDAAVAVGDEHRVAERLGDRLGRPRGTGWERASRAARPEERRERGNDGERRPGREQELARMHGGKVPMALPARKPVLLQGA